MRRATRSTTTPSSCGAFSSDAICRERARPAGIATRGVVVATVEEPRGLGPTGAARNEPRAPAVPRWKLAVTIPFTGEVRLPDERYLD